MRAAIKKITKKSWFYFLGTGGIVIAFFVKMFLGGTGIVNLSQLESDAKNSMMQTGVINIANADTPGGDGDGGGGNSGDCGSDGCGDSGSY